MPNRVRRMLVGDVAVRINNEDISLETKFRVNAAGFSQVYKEQVQHSTCSDRKAKGKSRPTLQAIQYQDCSLYFGVGAFISSYSSLTSYKEVDKLLLNTTLTGWLDQCNALALKSKRSREWYFIRINNQTQVTR